MSPSATRSVPTLWISLRSLTSSWSPRALASAFGLDVEPNTDVAALIRAALAHLPVVVVVDNCEHLLPGIAELIGALLESSPGARVVATSREALGVAGAAVCPIDPLRVPPAAASLEQIESSDAVALLLARLPMNLTTGPLKVATSSLRLARSVAGADGNARGGAGAARAERLATIAASPVASRLDPLDQRVGAAPSRCHGSPSHDACRSRLGLRTAHTVCPGGAQGDERLRRRLRPRGVHRRV